MNNTRSSNSSFPRVRHLDVLNAHNVPTKIAHRHHQSGNSDLGFMYLPGLMSDMDGSKGRQIMRYCVKNNLHCLLFDYGGHGQSGGSYREQNMGDWCRQGQGILDMAKGKNTILIASSMGSWIAIRMWLHQRQGSSGRSAGYEASGGGIVGLILLCPAINFTRELSQGLSHQQRHDIKKMGYFEDAGVIITQSLMQDGNENLITRKQLHEINVPVTVIHGYEDNIVPYSEALDLVNNLPSCPMLRFHFLSRSNHRLKDQNAKRTLHKAMVTMRQYLSPESRT